MTLVKDEHIAEELTQETFFQAIKSISKFDYSCKVSTWLCGIAKNVFLTYQRKNPKTYELDVLENVKNSVLSVENQIFSDLDKTEILKKLHTCSEPYREIMYLRLFGNCSFKEIGDVFGKTENWARVSFYRGKEKLRKEND